MAWRTTVVLQRGVNSNESINRDLRKAHLAFRELQFREREQTSTYHHALDRVASTIREYWQTLSHNVSSTPHLSRIRTHNVSGVMN
jgi:uncharacterized protein HemX